MTNLANMAGIGVAVAALAGAWGYIKMGVGWVMDLVICRACLTQETAEAVMAYCWSKGKRSPFGLRLFSGARLWVQPVKRVQVVAFESMSSDPILFWFGRWPMIISRQKNDDQTNTSAGSNQNAYDRLIFVRFLRGTMDVELLIKEAVRSYNATRRGINGSARKRFNVTRVGVARRDDRANSDSAPLSSPSKSSSGDSEIAEKLIQKTLRLIEWRPEDLTLANPNRGAFDGYAFPPEVMEAVNEMKLWLEHEEWFRSKSVPWRRGWLLTGIPGTGKSTLARAMAMHFDLPMYAIDLATHDNETFTRSWSDIASAAPCIALIEDVDTVFDGRKNISATNQHRDNLTFDCMLNCISGVGNSEGVFLMVTTNRPQALDPALGIVTEGRSSRPGRIDRVIELGLIQVPERRALAQHILSDFPETIVEVVAAGEGMTAAQFQNHCAQLALKMFWEKTLP